MIIVSYHSQRQIQRLLEQLQANGDNLCDIEIIIVVNGGDSHVSPPNPGVRVIVPDSNIGFARGCNAGAKHASGEVLLFCNPDIVISRECVALIGTVLREHTSCGTLSPYIDSARVEFKPTGRVHELRDRNIGACFGIRRELFHSVGGFDEGFFLWWEDTDLRERIVSKGLGIGFLDGVVVQHDGGHSTKASSREVRRRLTRIWISSHIRYLIKHAGVINALVWCIQMIVINACRQLIGKSSDREYYDSCEAVRFGILVLGNAAALERYVTFDGRGFGWGRIIDEIPG